MRTDWPKPASLAQNFTEQVHRDRISHLSVYSLSISGGKIPMTDSF